MQVKREDLNPCTILLTVTCSPDQVKSAFDKVVRDLSKKVRVPGFRPGMAPKAMVEDLLDPKGVYEKAAEYLVNKAYKQAVEEQGIEPEGIPAVDLTKFDRDPAECEFSAKVPLPPVVELGDITKLTAVRQSADVSPEEVDAQIEEFRKRQGTKKEVTDRGIQGGDAAVVTIQAANDESESRTFMVVVGQTFKGLDEALAGMTTDEAKNVKLDFPESFQHEAWKGKKLDVKVLVKSVSAVTLPEIDDTFAQGMDFDNLEALRERINGAIVHAKENMAREMLRDQLVDGLLAGSTVHVADNTWESVVSRRTMELNEELGRKGSTLEDYVKSNGMTVQDFQEGLQKEALINVQRAVVIQKIFTEQGMKIEPEDVDTHFRTILAENNIAPDKADDFAKQFGGQIREEIVFRAMASKVTDYLVKNAQISEAGSPGPAEKKPAPAKKVAKPKSK